MGRSLSLDVAHWAAIVSTETVQDLGATEPETAIPAGQRRRLPAFSRDVLRAALPLLRDKPDCPLIFTSPHGDLASTVTLLTDTARREPLSPSLFGLSVHNAPTGALSLSLDRPGDQISLAGDGAILSVGLTEAYAKLMRGDVASLVLIHADARLPEIYADFETPAPGVVLAMELRLGAAEGISETSVGAGRDGAVAVVRALGAGARRLRFTLPRAEARAA